MKHLFILCLLLSTAAFSHAAIINVPANQPTIQAGINAAQNGDTVLVAPGTYFENINFLGKSISVKSSEGAKVTIIDGGNVNTVVTFNAGEGLKSLLHGFTIQHGNATFQGGGIYIYFASPSITGNVVTNNISCLAGAGIYVLFSSALVRGNTISNNTGPGCDMNGAGIAVGGLGAAQIIGNVIENNTTLLNGGGIELNAAGTPTLKNNIIRSNVAYEQGGGIFIVNYSNALIVQNLIYNNTLTYDINAGQGTGIYLSVPYGYAGLLLVNNTIVGTSSSAEGSAVYASGFYDQVQFYNNLLIGASGTSALYCDDSYDQTPPTLTNNDGYSPNGTGIAGACSSQNGVSGNLSVDPMFVGKTNFHLKAGSPVIDAGDNSAPDLPPFDLGGKPRVVNGDGDGLAIIDMGAYEYQPPVR